MTAKIEMEKKLEKLTPEQRLWRSVLGMMVIDAFQPKYKDATDKDTEESLNILKDMDRSESFLTVCQFAGYNPNYIKRKVRKKFIEKIFSSNIKNVTRKVEDVR